MKDIQRKIYDDISIAVLNYLLKNEIEYDLKKEKNKITKRINQISEKDKEEAEVNERLENRIISLLNWMEKRVIPMPRKVYFSKHLLKRMDSNLKGDIINLINKFKKSFEIGEDVNSNLSKGIFSSSSWDYVLNIWNIRHLHLSKSVEINKSAMSENRSDYLLFFMLKENNVYFIDVRKHPRGAGFTSFEFLEILDESNWLNIMGLEEIEGINNMKPVIEKDEDIYHLTKAGLNIGYKINGKYYMNVMGITSLGNKVDHTFIMIEIRRKISKLLEEDQLKYI